MKDRLLQLLTSENMTALKFAEIMEIRPSNVSHILSGRNNPSFDFIARLLRRFPELNPDWVLNGDGDMYRAGFKHDFSAMGNEGADEATAVATLFSDDAYGAPAEVFANSVSDAHSAPVKAPQPYPYAPNAQTPLEGSSTQTTGIPPVSSAAPAVNAHGAAPITPKMPETAPNTKSAASNSVLSEGANSHDAQTADLSAQRIVQTGATSAVNAPFEQSNSEPAQKYHEHIVTNDAQQAQKLVIIYADNTFEVLTPKPR